MAMSDADLYEVLQVHPKATHDVIQAAYRALARRHHPDLASDPSSQRLMSVINAAWEILGDEQRRAEYDRARSGVPQPSASASNGAASPGARPAAAAPRHEPGGIVRNGVRWYRGADGTGAAGPPPGRPSGTILPFGRYIAWSIGEIARIDPGYLVWLDERPFGRPYHAEIEETLRKIGWDEQQAQSKDGRRRRWAG